MSITYRYRAIYFLILNSAYKVGVTNPTPLNKNLVLEICKKRDIESQMFGCSLASSFFS